MDELARRYRAAKDQEGTARAQLVADPMALSERSDRDGGCGQLRLFALLAPAIRATGSGYSRYWIGQLVRRYNVGGPEAMRHRQYTHSHRSQPLLSLEHLAELAAAV